MEIQEKKFCKRCGRKLVPDTRILSYDEYTGKPIYLNPDGKMCPSHFCRHTTGLKSYEQERGWWH